MAVEDLLTLSNRRTEADFVFGRLEHCRDNARPEKCRARIKRLILAEVEQLHNGHRD